MIITDLEPKEIWRYFYEITQTPRPSKKEEKITAYIHKFATEQGLSFKTDKIGNTVIYKPATKGKEGSPITILQSHLDMVCEKNADVEFDFENDPIDAYVEDGWVKARGTTLGADCGIGVAIAMAILASKTIAHPALEALFTIDEETSMSGANNLGSSILSGKYLINLDSEDEGEIFIGCAGGIDTVASFEVKEKPATQGYIPMRIDVRGLQGGHSGDDINKGFANANRALARLFFENWNDFHFEIINIEGGNLRNAIPREAFCSFQLHRDEADRFKETFSRYVKILKSEYSITEPDMEISLSLENEFSNSVFDDKFIKDILTSIVVTPNGVTAMSPDIPNFVETSTNLASVKRVGKELHIVTSQRSSVESRKIALSKVMEELFVRYGAHVTHSHGYPGWTPITKSELLTHFCESYKKLFGRDMAVKAVHAGLECGLILEKYPDLEMVSVGPTLRRVHSPAEKIDIKTVDMFWRLMVDTLEKI
ncbi:MAG: aminoacyl-histidine dipeptidase [Rikenellaceae bacterium]